MVTKPGSQTSCKGYILCVPCQNVAFARKRTHPQLREPQSTDHECCILGSWAAWLATSLAGEEEASARSVQAIHGHALGFWPVDADSICVLPMLRTMTLKPLACLAPAQLYLGSVE